MKQLFAITLAVTALVLSVATLLPVRPTQPQPGEVWELKKPSDDKEWFGTVKVLAVQDGWVQVQELGLPDRVSFKMETFTFFYMKSEFGQ